MHQPYAVGTASGAVCHPQGPADAPPLGHDRGQLSSNASGRLRIDRRRVGRPWLLQRPVELPQRRPAGPVAIRSRPRLRRGEPLARRRSPSVGAFGSVPVDRAAQPRACVGGGRWSRRPSSPHCGRAPDAGSPATWRVPPPIEALGDRPNRKVRNRPSPRAGRRRANAARCRRRRRGSATRALGRAPQSPAMRRRDEDGDRGAQAAVITSRHLLVVNCVMELGSVSAAARRLRVSQPSITKTVRMTEQELGISLFLRVGGRLQPTPEPSSSCPRSDDCRASSTPSRNSPTRSATGEPGASASSATPPWRTPSSRRR